MLFIINAEKMLELPVCFVYLCVLTSIVANIQYRGLDGDHVADFRILMS